MLRTPPLPKHLPTAEASMPNLVKLCVFRSDLSISKGSKCISEPSPLPATMNRNCSTTSLSFWQNFAAPKSTRFADTTSKNSTFLIFAGDYLSTIYNSRLSCKLQGKNHGKFHLSIRWSYGNSVIIKTIHH